MCAHVHPKERQSRVSTSHSLIYCSVTFANAILSASNTAPHRTTPGSSPTASPLTSKLILELFVTHLLSYCRLESVRHGIWPLDFKIPSYPCIYFKLNTEMTHPFSVDTTTLSWKRIAWKGANLTSVLLVFSPMIVLGLRYLYTVLTLEKTDLAGICFLCWGVVGKQVSDYYSNI